jgi:hypothetical protein
MSEKKNAKDVGSDSPASESAKQQRMSGTSGGAQASGESSSSGGSQPPQTSGRRDPAHEHDATVRKGYEAAEEPEKQGDGDPGPDRIAEGSSQQGFGGAGGGTGTGTGGTKQQSAQAGEPQGEHSRSGRQKAPGDRDPQQPE